jgi:hypothetical protein
MGCGGVGAPAGYTHATYLAAPSGIPNVGDMTQRLSARTDAGDRRPWLGLLVVLGPVLLVSMDGSILFLAMPRVSQALSPSADQALWILDIYGFAVGSLLIAFTWGADTPIYVPFDRLRSELLERGFSQFAEFEAGPGTALLARRRTPD